MAASLAMEKKLVETVLIPSRRFTLDQKVLAIPLPTPTMLPSLV